MSKLSLDLNTFKSAGIYTIEIDNSERITVNTQSLRLVPGFSTVGPYNVPVFIRSTNERQQYFGDIDTKLERKGSFFHRSIDTCLLSSPVFAINLLNLPVIDGEYDAADKVGFGSFSLDSSVSNGQSEQDFYAKFFNKDRFWNPDADQLQAVVASNENDVTTVNENAIINSPLFSIANVGTKQFSVIVRKSNVSGFDIFAANWYGSSANIPYPWIRPYDYISDYFIDLYVIEGNWSNYNELAVDPFWKYYFDTKGIKSDKLTQFINLSQVNVLGSWTGTIIPEFRDGNGADQFIETIVNANAPLTGVLINVNKDALDQLFWDSEQKQWEIDESSESAAKYSVDLIGHNLVNKTIDNISFLSYNFNPGEDFKSDVSIYLANNEQDEYDGKYFLISEINNEKFEIGNFVKKDPSIGIPGLTRIIGKTFLSADELLEKNLYSISASDGGSLINDISTGAYLIETAEAVALTTPISTKKTKNASSITLTPENVANKVTIQKSINKVVPSYPVQVYNGLTITNKHMPGYDSNGARNNEAGVEKIYSVLTNDQGILRGLINPEMIQYRYIVDTMAYGLKSEMGGKRYLSLLAKQRGKTTAIINMPSMTQFATSTNPYFCETFDKNKSAKPIFNTQYIAEGGNPNMPRSFRFSLPSEENGNKYMGAFGPFLKYNENGRTILVPPAADVSNAFLRKYMGGDPYAIVANKNGVLSNAKLSGVEYMIDKQDRDYLEPFGYNSIIQRTTTGEIMIYSNKTGYQTTKSDFNSLHVRELLNTMELQIDEVLQSFVFEYNNALTRMSIVNNISPILQQMKYSGALYDFTITCNESNNTAEVIDESCCIVDVGVWIAKGCEKIINRITVNKNSTTSTGGVVYV